MRSETPGWATALWESLLLPWLQHLPAPLPAELTSVLLPLEATAFQLSADNAQLFLPLALGEPTGVQSLLATIARLCQGLLAELPANRTAGSAWGKSSRKASRRQENQQLSQLAGFWQALYLQLCLHSFQALPSGAQGLQAAPQALVVGLALPQHPDKKATAQALRAQAEQCWQADQAPLLQLIPHLLQGQWSGALSQPDTEQRSAQLNAEHLFWGHVFPAHRLSAERLQLCVYLAGACLGAYLQAEPYTRHGLKPLLLQLLRPLWAEDLLTVVQLQQTFQRLVSWLPVNGEHPWAGYELLSELWQGCFELQREHQLVLERRNALHLEMHKSQEKLEVFWQQAINQYLKKFQARSGQHLLYLEAGLQTHSQGSRGGYQLLEAPLGCFRAQGLASASATVSASDATLTATQGAFVRYGFVSHPTESLASAEPGHRPGQAASSPALWKALSDWGRKSPQRRQWLARHQAHRQALKQFWRCPPPQLFVRESHQLAFESLWVPEGELLLYALLAELIRLAEQPGPGSPSVSEGGAALAEACTALGLLQGTAEVNPLKLEALYDACERLTLPARTGFKAKSQTLRRTDEPPALAPADELRALLRCFYTGPAPEQYLPEGLLGRCQQFAPALRALRQQTGLPFDLGHFQQLCPFPYYSAEILLHADPSRLCQHFLHPLIYEESPAEPLPVRPAAFLMGAFYDLTAGPAGQRVALPFSAALWKFQLASISYLLRYSLDLQLLQARQQAETQAQQQALQNQALRSQQAEQQRRQQAHLEQLAEYERVRQTLEQLAESRRQQALLWDQLQTELNPPDLLQLGIHSQRLVNEVFQQGLQVLPGLQGKHRPAQLETPDELDKLLQVLATGQQGPVDLRHMPESFLKSLYQCWLQPPEEQGLSKAQMLFSWLKLISYDAQQLEAQQQGLLRLPQLLQCCWNIRQRLGLLSQQLQKDQQVPIFFWVQPASASTAGPDPTAERLSETQPPLNLQALLLTQLPGLLARPDWQVALLGRPLADLLDSKQARPCFALAAQQRPLEWLAALERLCCLHLQPQEPADGTAGGKLQLQRLQIWAAGQQALWLELVCRGQLQPEQQAQILANTQDGLSRHDFSADLHKLLRGCGQALQLPLVQRVDSFQSVSFAGRHRQHLQICQLRQGADAETRFRVLLGAAEQGAGLAQACEQALQQLQAVSVQQPFEDF